MHVRPKGIVSLCSIVWIVLLFVLMQDERVGGAARPSTLQQTADQAQIDKGRQAVGQTCVGCHSNIMRIVPIHKKSADEWRKTVYSMIGRGAEILPEEIEPLTAFLTATSSASRPSASSPATPPTGSQAAAGALSQPLEAEGKAILQRSCVQCHDIQMSTKRPATDDWKAVTSRMMTYGATLTPADQQKLIEYLNALTK